MTERQKNIKTVIVNDWLKLFPSLKKYSRVECVNLLGPLMTGIYIKVVGNEVYTPVFFVHNLCRASEFITLSMVVEGETVSFDKHKDRYMEIGKKLADKIYFPLEGDLDFEEISQGYKRNFQWKFKASFVEYEDLLLLSGWTGRKELVEQNLELVFEELKPYREHRYFSAKGGFDTWFENVKNRAEDTGSLRKTYENEVVRHKTGNLPVREIII